ncbi:MAG: UDP-glucose/GDP-mannose dehydrogenase family protein [Patescibacteria group bacterium]|nr:UDP-glucose/GDP-mannose dehydrogenase family protein [Patescibacteria group bacterium]
MIKRASVIGLGKLGSPLVASFASHGIPTIGLDINSEYVKALQEGRAPVQETDLQKYIDQYHWVISATSDWEEAVMKSDASFIVVPTPSNPDGSFSNKFVVDACEKIGMALRAKKEFHIVAVVSTIMPESSEDEIIPILEAFSGKRAGIDFGYCYSPALIALGSVIRNFLNPDLVMIGESDKRSGQDLEMFYRAVVGQKPAIHRVGLAEAELAKIALNTFITTKISFANMLGMLSDKLGINVDNVTKIIGSDSRVGSKYLKAGGSYGGPCFPRDNRALARAAERLHMETFLPQATDRTNTQLIQNLYWEIEECLPTRSHSVGVIGLAYKLDTDVVEEAMGTRLAQMLAANRIPVIAYDPLAEKSAKKILDGAVSFASSLEECLKKASVIVVANPYPELANIDPAMLGGKTIIDCWRIVKKNRCLRARHLINERIRGKRIADQESVWLKEHTAACDGCGTLLDELNS